MGVNAVNKYADNKMQIIGNSAYNVDRILRVKHKPPTHITITYTNGATEDVYPVDDVSSLELFIRFINSMNGFGPIYPQDEGEDNELR